MKITDDAVAELEVLADMYMAAARDSTGSDAIAFRERSYGVRAAINVLASHKARQRGMIEVEVIGEEEPVLIASAPGAGKLE